LRIAKVCSADGPGQRLFGMRDRDQVDMIAHQAVPVDVQAVFVGLLFQQVKINASVVVHEEHILAVVPSLGDMMSTTDRDCTG
jgi:hypothetical protein